MGFGNEKKLSKIMEPKQKNLAVTQGFFVNKQHSMRLLI